MKEIERKFLVEGQYPIDPYGPMTITQGYIKTLLADVQIRVRITNPGNAEDTWASLTLKTPSRGLTRIEVEHNINKDDAKQLMAQCDVVLNKKRHSVKVRDHYWTIDVFDSGLVIAEIELQAEDEEFFMPSWVSEEVTGQAIYSNDELAKNNK